MKVCLICNIEQVDKQFRSMRKNGLRYDACISCEEKLFNDGKQLCLECKDIKFLNDFEFRKDLNKHRQTCKNCKRSNYKIYRKNKKNELIEYSKNYYNKNKDFFKEWGNIYRKINADEIKARKHVYYYNNKNIIKEKNSKYKKENRELYNKNNRKRYKHDYVYKIRRVLSSAIKSSLENKNNLSILDFLPYSIQELKNHLESLFEPWMNWNNWKKYNKNIWDDNDSSTWTWNLDHIIPQSQFMYTSMEDEEFKKCWSLNNLRPFSAKQNIIDGDRRYLRK